MSAVAGSSGGGRKGSKDPTKKKIPDSRSGNEDDEDGPKKRNECHLCVRRLNVSFEEHRVDCPGERDWSGEFRCMLPKCNEVVRYFGEMLRHWRLNHRGHRMPEKMRNRLRYVL